jgi:molybdopterin-binding protein
MSDPGIKLGARNRLPGRITNIKRGGVMAQVEMQVGDNQVVAVITVASVDELGLKVGDEAIALIKSTSVMIMTRDGDIGGL